jgi:hypothetical protein
LLSALLVVGVAVVHKIPRYLAKQEATVLYTAFESPRFNWGKPKFWMVNSPYRLKPFSKLARQVVGIGLAIGTNTNPAKHIAILRFRFRQ